MAATKPILRIGILLPSPGVQRAVQSSTAFDDFALAALGQHIGGNWGIISEPDWRSNDAALRNGSGRILSRYPFTYPLPTRTQAGGELWMITEADRSATTVLFSEES